MPKSSTPTFPRALLLGCEESDLVVDWYGESDSTGRVMIDVGAHRGSSTKPFAKTGWRVFAFEPDPANREVFERQLKDFDNVTVDPRAISEVDGEEVTLFDSDESSGISSLIQFVDSHQPATTVSTVRLDSFIAEQGIDRVDFLKIDTEGYDLIALRSYPFDTHMPDVVLCEFENKKTEHLGYTTGDMTDFLTSLGFTILVSEWHPIVRYGVKHSFARLSRFDGTLPPDTAWGNLIGVHDPAIAESMISRTHLSLNVRQERTKAIAPRIGFEAWRLLARLRARFAATPPRPRASS